MGVGWGSNLVEVGRWGLGPGTKVKGAPMKVGGHQHEAQVPISFVDDFTNPSTMIEESVKVEKHYDIIFFLSLSLKFTFSLIRLLEF